MCSWELRAQGSPSRCGAVAEAMDDIFFSRIRLTIVAELLSMERVSFTDLQTATGATRGNLGSHIAKLVESGVVDEDKRFVERRPLTTYHLTKTGRAALFRHIAQVEGVFAAVRREYGEVKRETGQHAVKPCLARA